MAALMQKLGIDQLSVEQRLALIEEIWVSIDAERPNPLLPSRAQIAEFEARLLEEAFEDEFDLALDDVEDCLEPSKHH